MLCPYKFLYGHNENKGSVLLVSLHMFKFVFGFEYMQADEKNVRM